MSRLRHITHPPETLITPEQSPSQHPITESNAPLTLAPPDGWWEDAFTLKPSPSEQRGHRCALYNMLVIVAYDITCHKRLNKVAKLCEDYGIRVQYSVFECTLEADRFHSFWLQLEELIDHSEDRIVAYKVCSSCAKSILTAGTMVNSTKSITYVF